MRKQLNTDLRRSAVFICVNLREKHPQIRTEILTPRSARISGFKSAYPDSYWDCGKNHRQIAKKNWNSNLENINLVLVTHHMIENEISYRIRGCVFKVYNNLGPGLLESAYEAALAYEMEKEGLKFRRQVALPMIYEEVRVETGYRLDLVVEEKVIIEIKSVEVLLDVHHKQLITYLKLSGLKLGLLINFNSDDLSKSIFRKVNQL